MLEQTPPPPRTYCICVLFNCSRTLGLALDLACSDGKIMSTIVLDLKAKINQIENRSLATHSYIQTGRAQSRVVQIIELQRSTFGKCCPCPSLSPREFPKKIRSFTNAAPYCTCEWTCGSEIHPVYDFRRKLPCSIMLVIRLCPSSQQPLNSLL